MSLRGSYLLGWDHSKPLLDSESGRRRGTGAWLGVVVGLEFMLGGRHAVLGAILMAAGLAQAAWIWRSARRRLR